MSVWNHAKTALKYTSPIAWLVTETAESAAKAIASASDAGIDQLSQEVAKQNLQMQIAQQQARVEQELAIARRIDNADEVEIEEFYDTSGKGGLNAVASEATGAVTLGLGVEGRRVTKRVYHFKGWRESLSVTVPQDPTEET